MAHPMSGVTNHNGLAWLINEMVEFEFLTRDSKVVLIYPEMRMHLQSDQNEKRYPFLTDGCNKAYLKKGWPELKCFLALLYHTDHPLIKVPPLFTSRCIEIPDSKCMILRRKFIHSYLPSQYLPFIIVPPPPCQIPLVSSPRTCSRFSGAET
ncbi:hypothetical protein ACTXT7_011541 [Hymenolepis weldensis]